MSQVHEQPTQEDIEKGILLFSGPIVPVRGFKQTGSRKLRKITDNEFKTAATNMNNTFGKYIEIRVPRSVKKQGAFITAKPEIIA